MPPNLPAMDISWHGLDAVITSTFGASVILLIFPSCVVVGKWFLLTVQANESISLDQTGLIPA